MAAILLIEDDPASRRTLGGILSRHGHEVVTAVNGIDGLEQFRTRKFDLLITDLMMSYGGLATIKALRATQLALRILAVSGSQAHLDAAQQLGADGVLRKPLNSEILLQKIADLLSPAPELGQASLSLE